MRSGTPEATGGARRPEGFDYGLLRPVAGGLPGGHRARGLPGAERFQGLALFGPGQDARRLDLRAGARDPLERAWVRVGESRQRSTVVLAVDVSASMRFRGRADRLAAVVGLVRALGEACHRRGDAFALMAADATPRPDLSQGPRRDRQAGAVAAARLAAWAAGPAERRPPGAAGLLALPPWMPIRRSLVILVSDGHLPPRLLAALLRRLGQHEPRLVLLADSAEARPPRRWGWAQLDDLETGRRRTVLLRPATADALAAHRAARLEALLAVARARGCPAGVAEDGLDLTRLGRALRAGVPS